MVLRMTKVVGKCYQGGVYLFILYAENIYIGEKNGCFSLDELIFWLQGTKDDVLWCRGGK